MINAGADKKVLDLVHTHIRLEIFIQPRKHANRSTGEYVYRRYYTLLRDEVFKVDSRPRSLKDSYYR